jgi:hypothetical protein
VLGIATVLTLIRALFVLLTAAVHRRRSRRRRELGFGGPPPVTVAGLYMLFLDPAMGALIWGGFLLVQFVPGVVAFRMDGERLGALWSLPFHHILYRQLMYLVLVQSIVTAVVGTLLPWQKLHHAGRAAADAPVRA